MTLFYRGRASKNAHYCAAIGGHIGEGDSEVPSHFHMIVLQPRQRTASRRGVCRHLLLKTLEQSELDIVCQSVP